MKNTIAERISDFLKKFPPFDLLTYDELLKIASGITVQYLTKESILFEENDTAHSCFYVVHKGAILLQKKENETYVNVDKCDEGDILGLRPLIAREPTYRLSARAAEESILYAISIDTFKPVIENNRAIAGFLIESFASKTATPFSKQHLGTFYTEKEKPLSSSLFELQPVKFIKELITCPPETPVKELSQIMSKNGIGSIIICENEHPKGIITDKDIRNKIATGLFEITVPAKTIMTAPVICYPSNISIAQAQIAMMKHKIGHLCITEDGTPNSRLKGLVSEHDIVVMQGTNPAVLMKAIKRAKVVKELKEIRQKVMVLLQGYLNQNIPLTHTSKIITELNDATIKKVIELRLSGMEVPPVPFAWMSLGSQGRKEQLLHTDQDNALVFKDVPKASYDRVKQYFLILAKGVTKDLNEVGYEYCPAEMMASNPKWCLSLSEWKKQFAHWIMEAGEEEIMLCSIFFDFDISFGDVTLTTELSDHIFAYTEGNQIFLAKLGRSALMNPSPLGFFRQFLVEQNGEHKDFFDLKKRALMPLTDAGRILIISHKVKHINNTAERFEKLAELEPENAELYLSCSYAAKALLKFRTKQGLLHNDSGRFIELSRLTKEEKLKLKRCFKTTSDIQELLKLRFKLAYFL
ncbi:DUF294 nucleotidyltransferase-like domain-containing protein [Ascidiimonas aurantiaca]|uniref:DUF294 nucleotidyltransferase-like domain-containing protein n=1 Tax=Ascidiimonas aurantiaca TaxID=1685432 RepID=UPI0030EB15D3